MDVILPSISVWQALEVTSDEKLVTSNKHASGQKLGIDLITHKPISCK